MWRLSLCLVCLNAALLTGQNVRQEAQAMAQRGVVAAQLSKYQEAIGDYQQAIALDPNLPGISLNLGLAWFKLGKFHEALAAFGKEDARAPSTQLSTLIAMSHFGLGQYREASERLKPLAAAQPANTELSYLLAKCYLWSGQYEGAMALFKTLLERDPNSPAVHMLMGEALDASDRTAEAIGEFEAVVKTDPRQPELHFGLGYLYWKQKRYEDAGREFERELATNSQNAQALAYLGDVRMRAGQPTEAIALLEKSVRFRPDLHLPHVDLGILYTEDKRYDAAIAAFRRAIELEPKEYDAHYRLARLYRELGRTREANTEFAVVERLHQKSNEEPLLKISGPQ